VLRACLILLLTSSVLTVAAATPQGELKSFMVLGTVVSVDRIDSTIAIKQSQVDGYTEAFVRHYLVDGSKSLKAVRRGDKIMATFSSGDGMLHHLRIVSKHVLPSLPVK
jgi:hypothetical protein